MQLSPVSLQRLATCDPRLQRIVRTVATQIPLLVVCGRRGKADQDAAVKSKKSKTPWPESKHNCPDPRDPSKESLAVLSRAVDLAPYPLDWNDRDRFILLAGYVLAIAQVSDILIRWGGDWGRNWIIRDESFQDLVHFELIETK